MKNIVLILLLTSQFQLIAQHIGKDKATEDLNFLVENIKKYNPALPYYSPEFDSLSFQVINKVADDSITLLDYFSKVNNICALSNEGHFQIGSQGDIIRKGFTDNTYSYLPMQVKIIEGKLYLEKDYSNEQTTKKGEEIIAINGMKTPFILNQMVERTSSDGKILTYAYRKIEDGFPWLYYYYISQPEKFKLTLIDSFNKKKIVDISALTRADQVANFRKFSSKENSALSNTPDSFYTLLFDPNYAYLKLPSFDFKRVNKYNVESKKLYKEIFKELQSRNTQNLFIDLRDNTGGRNEFADDIIPFIMKTTNNDSYLKKTIKWDGKTKTYKLPNKSNLAFKGSIYVFVNGKTYSAGSSLARFLKEYGNATVIGTETGTRYEGFAAGSREEIMLPNSNLKIGIPRYHILFPKSKKQKTNNRGLLPDYEIIQTYDSYSTGVDLHMKKAISLIDQ